MKAATSLTHRCHTGFYGFLAICYSIERLRAHVVPKAKRSGKALHPILARRVISHQRPTTLLGINQHEF